MSDKQNDTMEPTAEPNLQTTELAADDLDAVAGGHIDENTSIWHDIGTLAKRAWDAVTD